MSSEAEKGPLEKWLGPDASRFYEGVPERNKPPLPTDQISEIIAEFNANRETIINSKGLFKFKDTLDCVLLETPAKQESIKIRKTKVGSQNAGLLYRHSPTGWVTIFSDVPNIFAMLEPNTLYIGVGKWKIGEYQGSPSFTLNDCRAFIKVVVQ